MKLGEVIDIENPPSDSLRIKIVKLVEVYPTYKSIYLGTTEEFTIEIREGSGHFIVSYDNHDMIDLVHKDR